MADRYEDQHRRDRGYRRDERGFVDRAGDEVRSWFGDDEAERRRQMDDRERGQFRDRDTFAGGSRYGGYDDRRYGQSGEYGSGYPTDRGTYGYGDRSYGGNYYGSDRSIGSGYGTSSQYGPGSATSHPVLDVRQRAQPRWCVVHGAWTEGLPAVRRAHQRGRLRPAV